MSDAIVLLYSPFYCLRCGFCTRHTWRAPSHAATWRLVPDLEREVDVRHTLSERTERDDVDVLREVLVQARLGDACLDAVSDSSFSHQSFTSRTATAFDEDVRVLRLEALGRLVQGVRLHVVEHHDIGARL